MAIHLKNCSPTNAVKNVIEEKTWTGEKEDL
jgi:hypothetical protein